MHNKLIYIKNYFIYTVITKAYLGQHTKCLYLSYMRKYLLTYPAKLLVYAISYIQTYCVRAAKDLASLRICADWPEPLLLADKISAEISRTSLSYKAIRQYEVAIK